MKMKKNITAFLSVLLICANASIPVSAKAVSEMKINEIAPMYAYGIRLGNSLSISAKVAKCKSYGSGIDTIKQIAVEHTLQKLSSSGIWNNVSGASWSKASKRRSDILSSSKSDLSIGTYR